MLYGGLEQIRLVFWRCFEAICGFIHRFDRQLDALVNNRLVHLVVSHVPDPIERHHSLQDRCTVTATGASST